MVLVSPVFLCFAWAMEFRLGILEIKNLYNHMPHGARGVTLGYITELCRRAGHVHMLCSRL